MRAQLLQLQGLGIVLFILVAALVPFAFASAVELGTLQSVSHGGIAIEEGDTISRDNLLNLTRAWSFSFTWPNTVANNRSFLGVFRGAFGDLEGGAASDGVNYAATTQSWGTANNISKSINLPALGELDTTSSTYTALVAERGVGVTLAEVAEWFATSGTSGIEPVNYALLTFTYDAESTPENLNSVNFIEHGGVQINEGNIVLKANLTGASASWDFNFDWPRAVDNQRALFAVLRGTFGDLEGDTPDEGINYATNLQTWGTSNPKSITKNMALPPLLDASTTDGTYTVMIAERDPKYIDAGSGFHPDDQVEWFASGGAEGIPPLVYSLLKFEFSTLDPLLLQYEPILYLHHDENYQPMNVEAFIEASALWESDVISDDLLISRGEVTVEDIGTGSTDEWYLAFSSDEAKTFDPAVASSTYKDLVADGKAVPTYYGYKTEDSFVDAEGVLHEFIVLQYWYFYAFNDWQEQGGFNNHEGDWETVMIFLDKETEEPLYVAYSSHLNDGDPETLNLTQSESVRRAWDSNEVVRESDQLVSFVSLGSHANYPNNGDNGTHVVSRNTIDRTDTDGTHLMNGNFSRKSINNANQPIWMRYEGGWGADMEGVGEQGPQGPGFLDTNFFSSLKRFHEPVRWAGLDKIGAKTIFIPTSVLNFVDQLTVMTFSSDLSAGTEVSVDLQDERITFGLNLDSVTLLPHFRDIESSLENETFEVEIQFEYDQAEVDALELEERDLSVFLYNEVENIWERVESVVDTVANTISFNSTHFSRYAIGVQENSEEETTEEIYDRLHQTIKDSELSRKEKRISRLYLRWAEFLGNKSSDRSKRRAIRMLEVAKWYVARYEKRGRIDEITKQEIFEDINELIQRLRDELNS